MLPINQDYAHKMRVILDDHRFFCVTLIGNELLITNRKKSITLLLNRTPLLGQSQFAMLAPKSAERYLQTKIRAVVRQQVEFLLKKAK